MSSTLNELMIQFRPVRFGSDCSTYRRFAQELLSISDQRGENLEAYYELMENVLDGLFHNYCDGTLSEEEKSAIFSLIRADWSDDAPGGQRASMLSLLGVLQPLPGITDWLLPIAERQSDQTYVQALRACALCARTKPAV